jgi:RNA polymerase sigma-70 factor (subfamily 1)
LTSTISHNTEHLIDQARHGDPLALGPLLSSYSDQLRRLANRQLDEKLRGRISPSDIVQETLLQATRDIASFRGVSDAEFGSWLRRILARKISKSIERHVLAEKRDVRRETFLGHSLQGQLSDLTGHHEHRAVADPRGLVRQRKLSVASAASILPQRCQRCLLLIARSSNCATFKDCLSMRLQDV